MSTPSDYYPPNPNGAPAAANADPHRNPPSAAPTPGGTGPHAVAGQYPPSAAGPVPVPNAGPVPPPPDALSRVPLPPSWEGRNPGRHHAAPGLWPAPAGQFPAGPTADIGDTTILPPVPAAPPTVAAPGPVTGAQYAATPASFFTEADAAPAQALAGPPAQAATPQQPTAVTFDETFGGGDAFGDGGVGGGEQIAADQGQHTTGWRKAVSTATFGLVTPGPSVKQRHAEELVERIRGGLADVAVVAFVNAKGGVGKTTTAVGVGNTIASIRGDRVIVVDADTDLGNLSARFRESGAAHANIEALSALQDANSYSTVSSFTVQNADRLEMLSSQNDPRSSYLFNTGDFTAAMRILRKHYNVVLLDCGTSITSPLFAAIAEQVDCLVVVSSTDAPGLNGAWKTLGWLHAHGFGRLLPRTVLAVNSTSGNKPPVDIKEAKTHFLGKVPNLDIIDIPFDKHLYKGGFIHLEGTDKKTRGAFTELAGAIAKHYPRRRRASQLDGIQGY